MTQHAQEFVPTADPGPSRAFPAAGRAEPAADGTSPGGYLSEVFGLGRFHKIGLVEDLGTGRTWCLQSDEGASLGGTNLAPAPLFQWLAGIQADVAQRIAALAASRSLPLEGLFVAATQGFASQGSFARGEAVAHVFDLVWDVEMRGGLDDADARSLVDDALRASPAVATMREAVEGRFALHTNGRRTDLDGVLPAWSEPTVKDPLRRHAAMPAPADGDWLPVFEFAQGEGQPADAAAKIATHSSTDAADVAVGFHIDARGELDLESGIMRTATGLPDMTNDRWIITSDPTGSRAPAPLALVAVGAAFCYHTQLSRYVTVRRLDLKNSSLAQLTRYEPADGSSTADGVAHPILTDMFLNGSEPEEATRALLGVAANTCYVHRAMGVEVPVAFEVSAGIVATEAAR